MLWVPPIPENEIHAWPLAGSGLPTRVVNSARRAGLETVGELRTWPDERLLRLRSLGRASLKKIHAYNELCERIAAGRQSFEDLEDILRSFLREDEYRLLSMRYGLTRPDPAAGRAYYTLQEIGLQEHCTRERVRQVIDQAMARLTSAVCRACLHAAGLAVTARIRRTDESIGWAELAGDEDPWAVLAGLNPCSALLLLTDLLPDAGLRAEDRFFTLLSADTIARLRTQALDAIEQAEHPLRPDALARHLHEPADVPVRARLKAAGLMLENHPEAGVTTDRLYFSRQRHLPAILGDVMQTMTLPAHYRTITLRLNQHLHPQSRLGSGAVLSHLNESRAFTRTSRGMYSLLARRF